MLKRFDYFDIKSITSPFDSSVHLTRNTGNPVSQKSYSQQIGSLMYLANRNRPDIAFAVGRLSRYISNPNEEHWEALKRIFRYLKGTINYTLTYTGFPSVLEGYSDANWITDSQDVKSTSGYVFLLGGAAVSWCSNKQTIITRSTMEAELTALDTACTEAEWIKNLVKFL